jgi:S1-C subfamily serine protease
MDDFEYPTRRYDRDPPSYSDWPTAQVLPPPPSAQPDRGSRSRVWPAVLVSAIVAALVSAAVSVPLARRTAEGGGAESAGTGRSTSVSDPTDSPVAGDQPVAEASEPVIGQRVNSPVETIAASLLPSVAMVQVGGPMRGSGSAVVFRDDGYLVTNDHVVGDADQVTVTFGDGQPRTAEVVGTAQFTDLAVIKVDGGGSLPVPEFATETPSVGRLAVAIGSPFGLDATVTSGIVSALDRELATEEVQLSGLIQTDAAINPGNSGGALADDEGRVIGINTAILSSSRSNSGVGFAIPASTVVPIAERLIADGEVIPGFLGITGGPVTPEVAERFDTTAGAVTVRVFAGTPADEAGMREGDIITRLDDTPIDSMVQLSSEIQRRSPGETITLGIVRDGEEIELEVALTERPDQP